MQIKVLIKTPKGNAKATEKKIRPFLVKSKEIHETRVNKADNQIVWTIDCTVKRALKIQKNVAYFDTIMKGVMNNKTLKKAVRSKLSDQDEKELNNMLSEQTSVKIIKQADAEELAEINKPGLWERIKGSLT